MAATSLNSATSCASKCSLFLRKKLIGISIRPPHGRAEGQQNDQDAEVEEKSDAAPSAIRWDWRRRLLRLLDSQPSWVNPSNVSWPAYDGCGRIPCSHFWAYPSAGSDGRPNKIMTSCFAGGLQIVALWLRETGSRAS